MKKFPKWNAYWIKQYKLLFAVLSILLVIFFGILFLVLYVGQHKKTGKDLREMVELPPKEKEEADEDEEERFRLYLFRLPAAAEELKIRVMLTKGDGEERFFDHIAVSSPGGFTVMRLSDGERTEIAENVEISFYRSTDCAYRLTPADERQGFSLPELSKTVQTPYAGSLEIHCAPEGLYLVNELPLEEYLRTVVPSEMPASYPAAALEAQALCARTYAMKSILHPDLSEYQAQLDDSTSFQVYHNRETQMQTDAAIDKTRGLILEEDGEWGKKLTDVFFYSTSWGMGSDTAIWHPLELSRDFQVRTAYLSEEEFSRLLFAYDGIDIGESREPYFRWSVEREGLSAEALFRLLQEEYQKKPSAFYLENDETVIRKGKKIKQIKILERGKGGAVVRLLVETDKQKILILGESMIRRVLGGGTLTLQDGTKKACGMLPSSFFQIRFANTGDGMVEYSINGGGFGHGIGMSQNGARALADNGYTTEEIIRYYFPESEIMDYEDPENHIKLRKPDESEEPECVCFIDRVFLFPFAGADHDAALYHSAAYADFFGAFDHVHSERGTGFF